jgi:hypothetical protein
VFQDTRHTGKHDIGYVMMAVRMWICALRITLVGCLIAMASGTTENNGKFNVN